MANLLGTPSLSPQTKKSTDGIGAKSKEIAPPHESTALRESTEQVETSKTPAKEPSKLRSGWDAVTSFFGIQSSASQETKADGGKGDSETVDKQPPASREQRSEGKQAAASRSGKKSTKTSFWADDVSKSVEPAESDIRSVEETNPTEVFAAGGDEPVVSFGARKRERTARGENTKPRREPRNSSVDAGETPRQKITPSQNASFAANPLESDDIDGPVERRSQRRAPRRGRSDALDEGEVETPSARGVIERKDSERKEHPSNRRSRSAENTRSVATESADSTNEPVARTEDARGNEHRRRGGQDRPGRERAGQDSAARSRPTRERPERTDRPERTERVEREVVARDSSDREGSVSDAPERESGRRNRDRRSRNDDSRSEPERRRPAAARRAAPVDEIGFGAGLRESDDGDDDLDSVSPELETADSIDDDSTERSAEGSRRGRNQRRGRRSSGRVANSAEDAERMEADESEKKFIKVPSWIEALDGILQSNMDNHQRNNHGRDRNRGRGPRNNDR